MIHEHTSTQRMIQMENYKLLIFCYCIIFTIFNFGVFLTCYLFGFTYDRELRQNDNRIILPPFFRFFLYFKGIQSDLRSCPTKLCGGAEIFAFVYFILMETANILIAKLSNDFVLSCRISIALFALIFVATIITAIITRSKIKIRSNKNDIAELNEYLTPKETIDINNDKKIDNFLCEPHERPDKELNPLNMLDGKSFDSETADVSLGMEAVNQMKAHIIIDDAQENEIVENILSSQTESEKSEDRETADFREGMKRITEMRENPIDNDF